MREALAAARQELGAGALVLSTELVPAQGWRGWLGKRVVRLTAAAERPGLDDHDESDELVEVSAPRPAVTTRRHRPSESNIRSGVVARLVAAGMDLTLAEAVVGRMSDAECRGGSDSVLRRALSAELAPVSGVDADYERYEVFVGPPGVGKTTTIAKIAAQERVMHNRALNLVAADCFRAGAIEQLRGYAEIMAVPFRVARNANELAQVLTSARGPMLIDTAGRAPSDDGVAGLFAVLNQKRSVRTHLVLAADTSQATARRTMDRYAALNPSRVVITKLDETESVMPLLAAVMDRGLLVSYLTAGQRVPEDLWRATPGSLAAALLREPALEEQLCH